MSEETKTVEELLPCPFCGGKAERCRTDPDIDEYFIECSGCEASSGSMYGSTTEASKAWNTRSNTAERERREAAENLLEEFREDAQANIDRQSDCSDPDRECPLQDAHKDWSTAGILQRMSEYREKYPKERIFDFDADSLSLANNDPVTSWVSGTEKYPKESK